MKGSSGDRPRGWSRHIRDSLVLLCLIIPGCGSGLRYTDAELRAFDARSDASRVSFETAKGSQVAFFVQSPRAGAEIPHHLVLVYPGIGSRALDWLWMADGAPVDAGFLFLDYPGRGLSKGTMRPSQLPDTTQGALFALADQLRRPREEILDRLYLLGHSFGTAAALQAAQDLPARRIVLVAPFTTMHKALFRRFGPLAWLIPNGLDNRLFLGRLHQRPDSPALTIFHGNADRSIPIRMGRSLAKPYPGWIRFVEVKGAGHVNILKSERKTILKALFN
ncbi:alpha/beta hydrolase [bacterium]|nr:alpha/beta hydrolase [bacterium]